MMKKFLSVFAAAVSLAAAAAAQTQQPAVSPVPAQPAQQAAPAAKPDNSAKFARLFPKTEGVSDKIGPGFFSRNWRWLCAITGAAAVAAYLLLRPKRVPPPTPYETASTRIAKATGNPELSAKEYAQELGDSVRCYIEAAHDLPAPERTTQEFLKIAALAPSFDETEHEILREILTLSDMAKFALHSFSDVEKTLLAQRCKEFVDYDNKKSLEKSAAEEKGKDAK